MKPLYTILFSIASLTWPSLIATAQRGPAQTTFTGAVQEGSGKPVPFATVALLNASDSSVVKGTASDQAGRFTFDNIRAGQYLVRASAVGYKKTYSLSIIADNESVSIPTLILTEITGQLNTVQVTAKKPFVEQQIDRMVVNVAGSIVGSGSTALEVLEKSPGVTVDYQNEPGLSYKKFTIPKFIKSY